MKNAAAKSSFLLLLALAFPAAAGDHAFVEPGDDDPVPYLWSYVGYWKTCADYPADAVSYRSKVSALGAPGDGKVVHVDSERLTPEHPLRIDDGRFVSVSQVFVGTVVGDPYGIGPHVAALEVGPGATLVTANLDSNLTVGDRDGALGALILDAGSTVSNNKFRVGSGGCGVVTNNGGRVWTAANNNGKGIYIGYGATGVGRYVQNGGFSDMRTTEIGVEGDGTLEFRGGAANVVAPSLGTKAGGRGTYVVYPEASVTNGNVSVGVAEGSRGTVDLRGGDFLCTGAVTVRSVAGADGEIRGWGRMFKPSATSACGEMNGFTMNGRVVADGGGVGARALDFSYARGGNDGKVNVKTTIANGARGTNGWYAVRGGTAVFPLLHVNSSAYAGTFGDNTNLVCDLVNTVRIDYRQTANRGPWLEARLYAEDAPEVPAGLAAPVLGVWGFRSNVGWGDRSGQLADSAGFDVRFRYDHRRLRAGDKVVLLRHDPASGKWTRLARAAHDPASPYLGAEGLLPDGGDRACNLGVFALVNEPNGLVIVIR